MPVVFAPKETMENLARVAETVESKSAKIYQTLVDSERAWARSYGKTSIAPYRGHTSKELRLLYAEKFPGSRRIGKYEMSKRTNDLARSGRIVVASKTKDPSNGQNVYRWRTTTPEELGAMHAIGALKKNRVPVNWDEVWSLNAKVLPFKHPGRMTDLRTRRAYLQYKAQCLANPDLDAIVEGQLNEIMFRGVRLLGMDAVFSLLHKPHVFLKKSVEAILKAGRPKRPGLGPVTLQQCDEYRRRFEDELTVRIPGRQAFSL